MANKKGKTVTQFNLFDEPEVMTVKKNRRKMTDREKEERKEDREVKKKIEADKRFAKYWGDRGVFQGEIFSDEEVNEGLRKALKDIIKEEIENVLSEEDGIHIKPENRGKFTQTKERTGKTTSELLNSKDKKTRARANFARMAKRGWKPLKK